MSDLNIVLPSKPKIVSEDNFSGVYEIDGLYPGYGHTLGNSLRRIILSSLPGAAITTVKIEGASHEFSVLTGIKEDAITILLNLKRIRIKMSSDEAVNIVLKKKGVGEITAGDIDVPGQVEILNPELVIAHVTEKSAELSVEMTVEKGLGYVSKDVLQKNRMDIGAIAVDAIFTPIRRANYEVENMRVGDRTDFNRLRLSIETDGTISPKVALEKSIELMINQLRSIVGFKEEEPMLEEKNDDGESAEDGNGAKEVDPEVLKTRTESLGFSARTLNALTNANIRTVGGLARKREKDILEIDGLGAKGVTEIKKMLGDLGITLK